LASIARAADSGDLSGTPRQGVEAVAFGLISDAAVGLPNHQLPGVLAPTARLVGSFLDELEAEGALLAPQVVGQPSEIGRL
jgi:hypothetical protein